MTTTTQPFRSDNTEGYSAQDLDALNAEFDRRAQRIEHACSVCGEHVVESCPDHPTAMVDSVSTTVDPDGAAGKAIQEQILKAPPAGIPAGA